MVSLTKSQQKILNKHLFFTGEMRKFNNICRLYNQAAKNLSNLHSSVFPPI
jgi:hypothetical protein